MKKIKYTTGTWKDETGIKRTFNYYILVNEVETPVFFTENYGISVEELQGVEIEMFGISPQLQRVEGMLDFLVKHQVSPTHCKDIVEDWL